jgi:hypothetical protein
MLHLIRLYCFIARNAKVVPQEPEPPIQATHTVEREMSRAYHRPLRPRWAKPLNRVFSLDPEHCLNCGGEPIDSSAQSWNSR